MAQYSTLDPKKLIYVAGVEALKEFNEGKRVRVSNSKVKLTVSPFLPPFVPIEILGADVSGLITSVSWQKSLSSPAGNFSITMVNDKEKIKKIGLGYPLSSIWTQFGASLLDVFKPMSTAKLDIGGYHIMTGFVESVKKSTNGEGQESVTVEYSELGELYNRQVASYFQNFKVGSDELFMFGNPDKILSTSLTLTQGTLANSLFRLVQAFLSSTLNYGVAGFPPYFKWADGGTLPFKFVVAPAPLGGIATDSFITNTPSDFAITAQSYGQTFWDWVKRIAQDPFMECFTESGGRTINTGRITNVGGLGSTQNVQNLFTSGTFSLPKFNISPTLPGLSYLIVRSSPYDNPYTGYNPYQYANYNSSNGVLDLILSGDFIMVNDYDVVSKELGQSQESQYTAFKVKIARGGSVNTTSGMGYPVFSRGPLLPIMPGGQRTFGNRYYEKEFDVTSSNPKGFANQVLDKQTKKMYTPVNPIFNVNVASTYLQAWYRNASKYREGSITTRMIPYARPGMMLLYVDPKNGKSDDQRENGMYYIESMAGNWEYGGTDSTQFSVTRGTPLPFDTTSLSLLMLDWELTNYSGLDINIPPNPR